jgi:hypothetical protein
MERRDFLKFAFGVAAGAAAFAGSARAAPLSPQPIDDPAHLPRTNSDARPAVTTTEEAAQLKPEQVRWHGHGHGHHWGWRHHHWRHRHWGRRHRHWGWRRRWHRRHWRHHYW